MSDHSFDFLAIEKIIQHQEISIRVPGLIFFPPFVSPPWLTLRKTPQKRNPEEKKRTAMWADQDWINYTQESAKLGALESQENKLLKPVDFYDIKV